MEQETVEFQPRLGTTENLANFTGIVNEAVLDTTKKVWVICDGNTRGGFPQAREDLSNVSTEAILNKGVLSSDLININVEKFAEKGLALADGSNLELSTIFDGGVAKADGSNIAHASTSEYGVVRYATVTEVVNGSEPDIAISPFTLKSYLNAVTRTYTPMFITGFNISYVDNSNIKVSTGSCRTLDDVMNLDVNAVMTLTLTSRYSNATYYVFVAANDSGAIQGFLDTNIVPSSMIALGYKHYRRVGCFRTNQDGNVIPFKIMGDIVYYDTPRAIAAPTNTYTQKAIDIPESVTVTPIIKVTVGEGQTYSIGIPNIAESSAIDFTSSGVLSCFKTQTSIMQKGSGTATLIGYIDTRTYD